MQRRKSKSKKKQSLENPPSADPGRYVHCLARALSCAAILLALASGSAVAQSQASQASRTSTFTASPFTGFHAPLVEAMLYNPPLDEVPWKDLDKPEPVVRKVEPSLVLNGRGLTDGTYRVSYHIESGEKSLYAGTSEIKAVFGVFELVAALSRKYPEATGVSYELKGGTRAIRGRAVLSWSRFHGQVKYLDGGWRSTYAELHPNGFASQALFYVPVLDDGNFDALVPARVYSVINVNGSGYSRNSMERWAWDYDLTEDREDVFTIGRTELYGMHAFNIVGGPRTVFVAFRPTALTRVLQFDTDGDGQVSEKEREVMVEAMKQTPTAIGPELEATDVAVWMNGVPQKIAQFNQIPEYDGEFWQVQYLLQFLPEQQLPYGVWQEIRIEVRSKEKLRGKEIVDFGQGSVGFYRK